MVRSKIPKMELLFSLLTSFFPSTLHIPPLSRSRIRPLCPPPLSPPLLASRFMTCLAVTVVSSLVIPVLPFFPLLPFLAKGTLETCQSLPGPEPSHTCSVLRSRTYPALRYPVLLHLTTGPSLLPCALHSSHAGLLAIPSGGKLVLCLRAFAPALFPQVAPSPSLTLHRSA